MHTGASAPPASVRVMAEEAAAPVERCLRCSAPMEWRHQTWQCVRCRFKLGCCEGDAPDACGDAYASERR